MDKITLELAKREVVGKGVKQLRRDGLVPAVIHDHGKESIVVSGQYVDMVKVYRAAGKHHPVALKADGKNFTALIKKAEFDPRKNTLTHVVFGAVKANETVTAEIPVHIVFDEGNDATPAERAGLVVLHQLETVEVEAKPNDLPDVLEFNGEKLVAVGDQATVAELKAPSGVTIKADPTHVLATVFEPSALAAANDAVGGDADEEDQGDVPADHESGAEEGTQEGEIRPGGKKENEDKSQGHNPEKQ
jgi:large subunit ribosomal protein L25